MIKRAAYGLEKHENLGEIQPAVTFPLFYVLVWFQVPETDGQETLPVLLDEKVIPSIGRLLVYSDYKVHATFRDGITLNMVWDFSSGCRKIQVTYGLYTTLKTLH